MQLLNIRFSAIDESNFIVNARSGAGQAESKSSLPFYETKTKWRTTLIKILEIGKFSHDKFSDEEKLWMAQEGLLLSDGNGFSADYLEKIGRSLYKTLFPTGEVSDLLQRSIALAEQDLNPQLHIQIEFNAKVTELNRLPDYPWEMVHDGQRFLAHHNVTFSRYIAHLSAPPTLSSVSPINVLLVSSGASDEENGLAPLSKKEHEAVKKGLEKSQEDGHIRFSVPEQASCKTLTTYLTEHRGDDAPHVLHFDGHGVFGKRCLNSECRTFHGNLKLEKCKKCGTALSPSQGYLLFEPDDDEREANYVSAEEIGSLLRSIRHGDSESQQGGVRLAVLSACKSAYALGGNSVFNGVAQSLIGHGVPAVVAMQYTVSTKGATAFAEGFYRELGNKQSLAVATSQGRVAMQTVEHNQWYRLIFYLRWQANDGGQLFATVEDNSAKSQTTRTISIPSNVRQGSKNFVGREEELAEIHAKLQEGQGVIVCAVEGMGGVGKTELALQYANRYQQEYEARYWLSLRGVGLAQAVVSLASPYLDLPEAMQSASLDAQAAWCWQNWLPKAGNLLVILDDVPNAESIPDLAMPIDPRVRVLVTTRERELNMGFESVPLDVLSEEKALELLRKIVGVAKVDKELVTVKEICKTLGYLPLGLELIGEYLSKNRFLTFAKLQEKLTIADDSIARERKGKFYGYRGVEAAIQLSWDDISTGSQRVAMLLGLFAPVEILWELVAEIGANAEITEAELNEARGQLDSLHLIQPINEECNFYKIHPLVREFFRAKLLKAEENHQFRQVFVTSLLVIAKEIPQSPTLDLIARVTPAIAHLDMLSREMLGDIPNPEEDSNLGWAFGGIARFYSGQGLYALAEDPWQRCLAAAKKILGDRHPDVASSLNNLAGLYYSQGRYAEAEQLRLQCLDIERETLGEKHPQFASSLNNLAELYGSQGRYADAEPLFQQALSLSQELLGDRHPSFATSLNNLAELYHSQGRYADAEPLFQQALSLSQELLGDRHPDVAQSLNNLAGLYRSQGRYAEAEPLHLQSLEIDKIVYGESHPEIATDLNNLALLYKLQGRYAEAEPLYLEALLLRRELLGDRHPDVATSLNNLARLYYSQGRYAQAEPLYLEALLLSRKLLGDRHPDVAQSLNNLAVLRYNQNRYDEAEALLLQALEIRESVLSSNHPDTQSTKNSIAYLRANRPS